MTICIIPAKTKNNKNKKKNIIIFNGKPIIYYAINLAKKSKLFSRIIVSTDDSQIAKIAKKHGAEVPFKRNKNISDDQSSSTEVIIDAIKRISSEKVKYHCCLYPTAVLTSVKDLISAYKKIKKTNADYLIPITDYNYSPYRSFKLRGSNWIEFLFKKYSNYRSQDLKSLYHDTGSFYFYKTLSLLNKKGNLTKKTTYLKIDRTRSVDINEIQDLKMANLQYKMINKKNYK